MDEERIPDVNPYQSPLTVGQDAGSRAEIKYPSAKKAFLAGAWRGAKFGGKWMALILGSIVFVLFVTIFASILYRMYYWNNFSPPQALLGLLEIVGMCILALLFATLVTAVISAIIMGIGEGVYYWRSGRRVKTPNVL